MIYVIYEFCLILNFINPCICFRGLGVNENDEDLDNLTVRKTTTTRAQVRI